MKRSLAYITAAWRGDPAVDMEQAAHYEKLWRPLSDLLERLSEVVKL